VKLNVRYEDVWEVIEMDDKDTEKLWISLSLEDGELTEVLVAGWFAPRLIYPAANTKPDH